MEYKVENTGSVLHWYFKTENHDIGFGMYFKAIDNKLKEIIAMDKRESHLIAQDGSYTCNKKGIYVITFDNSYSWTRNKKLYYQVDVTPCEQDNAMGTL